MSSTFLLEDRNGSFAYLEWPSQGSLPYDVLTTLRTIFNASTGQFVKNKDSRSLADLLPTNMACPLATAVYDAQGRPVAFTAVNGFCVGFAFLDEPKVTRFTVLKARRAGPEGFAFHHDPSLTSFRIYEEFNVEGSRTGRIPSSEPGPETQSPKR